MSVSLPISPDKIAKPTFALGVNDDLKAPASFCDLPRELQLFIFSYFSHKELCKTVAPVCQHWWKLSKDPSLWKSLRIYVEREEKTRNLALLLLRCPMLTRLTIISYFYLEEFAVFAYACPMLKHLSLGRCKVDHRILALFVQNCPLIQVLNLSSCDKVDQQCVSSIVSLQHLWILDISGCDSVDDNCILLISENCKHLEHLNLCGTGCTDKAICSLVENLHSTLLHLEISGDHVTDSTLLKIGLCTRLKHLFLEESYNLTDESLMSLKLLTDLRCLVFRYADSITTVAINNHFAGSHVHKLVQLELSESNISDVGVYNMTQNCKLLKTLRLALCYEVTEVGMEHIVKHCKNLTHLTLDYMEDEITGLCLQSVPRNLSRLESLDVEGCEGITESVLVDLQVRVPQLAVSWLKDDTVNL